MRTRLPGDCVCESQIPREGRKTGSHTPSSSDLHCVSIIYLGNLRLQISTPQSLCCARSLSHVHPTLCDPIDCNLPGSSVLGESPSGLPCPHRGDLPNPRIELSSPALQAYSLLTESLEKPDPVPHMWIFWIHFLEFAAFISAFMLYSIKDWGKCLSLEYSGRDLTTCFNSSLSFSFPHSIQGP